MARHVVVIMVSGGICEVEGGVRFLVKLVTENGEGEKEGEVFFLFFCFCEYFFFFFFALLFLVFSKPISHNHDPPTTRHTQLFRMKMEKRGKMEKKRKRGK